MRYRRLGGSQLEVSRICLGCMQFGWTADEATSFRIMDLALEGGCNFFDTADVYSHWAPGNRGGESEQIIGRWLKGRRRDEVILATKVRGRMWPGPEGEGLSRGHITRAIEDSLKRLGTDSVDLYQTHSTDPKVPWEETLEALASLVQAGKVRWIGASNHTAGELGQALGASAQNDWPRYQSLQPHYNLVHREEFEAELQALCLKENVGVIPYSPLAKGLLTDRQDPGRGRRYDLDSIAPVIERLKTLAREKGWTTAQAALAWALGDPAVTSVIVGASRPEQLAETLAAGDYELTAEERSRIVDVSAPA